MKFPKIPEKIRLKLLNPPTGKIEAVLDTDTYNEIDDPFAIAYTLLSKDRINLKAIYAAPFHNDRSKSAADGMEKSYHQIFEVLKKLKVDPKNFVFRGSREFLSSANRPIRSEAVDHLIQLAHQKRNGPLYVIGIAAITNIASAILQDPEIIRKIVVVWLGGHARHWPHSREFNLKQDPIGTKVLFESGVPLVQIPCLGVSSHLHATVPELERHLKGRGAIGNYLLKIFKDFHSDHYGWSKVIWDIAPIAWINQENWVPTSIVPSSILTPIFTWKPKSAMHSIRVATYVDRAPVFTDFFSKLDEAAFGKKARKNRIRCKYI
jgi:purine nucleosidase